MILWLLLVVLADEGQLLAPTMVDLDASLRRTERLLARADEVHHRLADAQQAWVAEGCVVARCPADRRAALLVAVTAGGHATRDLAQGARAELGRLERMLGFPTVSSLLDPVRADQVAVVRERTTRLAEAVVVRAAWTQRYVLPQASRLDAALLPCADEPELAPAPERETPP